MLAEDVEVVLVLVLVDDGVVDELLELVLDGVGVGIGVELLLGDWVAELLGGWIELLDGGGAELLGGGGEELLGADEAALL